MPARARIWRSLVFGRCGLFRIGGFSVYIRAVVAASGFGAPASCITHLLIGHAACGIFRHLPVLICLVLFIALRFRPTPILVIWLWSLPEFILAQLFAINEQAAPRAAKCHAQHTEHDMDCQLRFYVSSIHIGAAVVSLDAGITSVRIATSALTRPTLMTNGRCGS